MRPGRVSASASKQVGKVNKHLVTALNLFMKFYIPLEMSRKRADRMSFLEASKVEIIKQIRILQKESGTDLFSEIKLHGIDKESLIR